MAIMRCRESFSYWDDKGSPHDMPAGTLIESDRFSGFRGREHLFEDVEVFVDMQEKKKSGTRVESATQAPGEKRSVSTVKGTK